MSRNKFMNLYDVIQYFDIEHDQNYLFQDIRLPEGIEKATLTDHIIMEYGEYSFMSFNPTMIRHQINNFFEMHFDDFARLVKTYQFDYEPLHNYDRNEDIDRDYTHTGTVSNNDHDVDTMKNNDTITNEVSAYNSSSYQPEGQEKRIYNDSIDRERTDQETRNLLDTDDQHNHLYGNVGVTTTQQMFKEEIDLRMNYNLYRIIGYMFYDELMIHYN